MAFFVKPLSPLMLPAGFMPSASGLVSTSPREDDFTGASIVDEALGPAPLVSTRPRTIWMDVGDIAGPLRAADVDTDAQESAKASPEHMPDDAPVECPSNAAELKALFERMRDNTSRWHVYLSKSEIRFAEKVLDGSVGDAVFTEDFLVKAMDLFQTVSAGKLRLFTKGLRGKDDAHFLQKLIAVLLVGPSCVRQNFDSTMQGIVAKKLGFARREMLPENPSGLKTYEYDVSLEELDAAVLEHLRSQHFDAAAGTLTNEAQRKRFLENEGRLGKNFGPAVEELEAILARLPS